MAFADNELGAVTFPAGLTEIGPASFIAQGLFTTRKYGNPLSKTIIKTHAG